MKLLMRSRFLESEYDNQQIIAIFAISAGCTCTGPISIQREAPPALLPKPNTVTHRSPSEPTRNG